MASRRTVGSAVLCLTIAAAVFLSARLPPSGPGVSSMEEVRLEAARGGYRLIDLQALRALLGREGGRVLLVDTRQEWEYSTGHIPQAVNFPLEPTWWSRLRNRRALGRALGPDTARPIVFY